MRAYGVYLAFVHMVWPEPIAVRERRTGQAVRQCMAPQVAFLPFVFVMAGRWRPRKAREDLEAHERAAARELAALPATTG
jgi:hypothetical protein